MQEITQGKRFEFDNGFVDNPLLLDGIRLYQFGELYCEAGYEIGAHSQWCFEISYVIAGQGTFIFGEKTYEVQEGDLLITPLHASHQIHTQDGHPLRFAYMGFDLDDSLGASVHSLRQFYESPLFPCMKGDPSVMMAFVSCLEEFYQPGDHSNLMISSYVRQIVLKTYRNSGGLREDTQTRPGTVRMSGQAVYALVRYIDKHIYNLPDIRTFAKKLGYSHYYLSHVFKERTGNTIAQYIAQKKMDKACELMEQADLPIGKVAQVLGYSGVQAFSAAFKRVMGDSPSAYLKNIGENNTAT